MKIAVIGTGMVGEAIGSRLIDKGYQVLMGSRTANNEKAVAWVNSKASNAGNGTFADAANFAEEIIFNCTNGQFTIDALKAAGLDNLKGKVIIDIANPLDFSEGMPPSLSICNKDSLAEQVQKAFPEAHVVKSLNTMNCNIMLNPSLVSGDHNVFMSGNSAEAKKKVADLLHSCGWKRENIIDLGDITTARGTEMLLPIWLRLYGAFGNPNFNFHIQR